MAGKPPERAGDLYRIKNSGIPKGYSHSKVFGGVPARGKTIFQISFVISNRKGAPLSEGEFVGVWYHVKNHTAGEKINYKYVNGEHIRYTTCPILGSHRKGSPNHVYSLDFHVTPHQLRHTYITNLLYMGVDPKTVQYLAGHKNSKTLWTFMQKSSIISPKNFSLS